MAESNEASEPQQQQQAAPSAVWPGSITEADVGITEYVNSLLKGINGGIIKQRFSDFHVFEVAPGSSTPCHITTLDPPPGPLLDELNVLRAEAADPSGFLRSERLKKEASERDAAREAQKKAQEAAAIRLPWPEILAKHDGADDRLKALLGDEAVEALRTLGELGPTTRVGGGGWGGWGGRGGRGGARGGRGGRWGGGPERGAEEESVSVTSRIIDSKEERTEVHQLMRQIFEGRFNTAAVQIKPNEPEEKKADDAVEADLDALVNEPKAPAPPPLSAIKITWGNSGGAKGFDARHQFKDKQDEHPPYVEFLMQKSNRDMQDALSIIARCLNLGGINNPQPNRQGGHGGGVSMSRALRDLSVAGTKDKRGLTLQRVRLRRGRRTVDDVWKAINGVGKEKDTRGGGRGRGGFRGQHGGRGEKRTLLDAVSERGEKGIRTAHFEYAGKPLALGQLDGNAFVITLRDVDVKDADAAEKSLESLRDKGFVNYFGMQRFGSSSVATYSVGVAVLQGDFKKAVDLVMCDRPLGNESGSSELARDAYREGRYKDALKLFPRVCVPERSIVERIIRDLKEDGTPRGDWRGYFSGIPRTLRTMYVHALQSYVWNRMVSERIRRFGVDKPVVGDFVLPPEAEKEVGAASDEAGEEEDDAKEEEKDDEEEVALGTEDDEGGDPDSQLRRVTALLARAKVLTEADVEQYTIHDVVLPLPGSQIKFEEGSWSQKLYVELLAELELTPENVAGSSVPEFVLLGAFRKMIHLPRDVSWSFIPYDDPDVTLARSDEDKVLGIELPPAVLDAPSQQPESEGTGDAVDAAAATTKEEPAAGAAADAEAESKRLYTALQVSFTLGSSTYATMALREVLKQDTSTAVQKEMTNQRAEEQHQRGGGRGGGMGMGKRERDEVNSIQGPRKRVWGAPAAVPAPAAAESGETVKQDSQEGGGDAKPDAENTDVKISVSVSGAAKEEIEKLKAKSEGEA